MLGYGLIFYCLAKSGLLGVNNFTSYSFGDQLVITAMGYISPNTIITNAQPEIVNGLLWNELHNGDTVLFRSIRPISFS